MLPETSQCIYRAAIAGRGTWLGSVGGLGMILPIAYPLVWVGSSQQLVGVIRFAFSYDKLNHVSLCFLYLLFFICYSPIPFHSIVLFQATRPIHTKQRLGKNTESVQRKRIEAQKTKHTVKQSKHKKPAYTTTQLEATLPKHYYSHSNVLHRIS